jgi:2'-5' RNA ligase
MRAFLAVPVGPPAHALVAGQLSWLRDRVAGVRWVATATVHITLHFFAELPDDRVGAVVASVGDVAATRAPFALALGDLGSFPPGARARVLWRGLAEASDPLEELAAAVQAAVAACRFDIDPRPFRAHVTLGRTGPGFDVATWREEVARPREAAPFTADRVVLYESIGGRHLPREAMPLAGSPVVTP